MFRSSRGPLVVFTSAWGIGVVYGIALDRLHVCTLPERVSVCVREAPRRGAYPKALDWPCLALIPGYGTPGVMRALPPLAPVHFHIGDCAF